MQTCRSWHSRVAWYLCVSIHDEFGKRSRKRLIYSYSTFVVVAIVDATVAVYVVYSHSVGSEFLEIFNQSLGAISDIFIFVLSVDNVNHVWNAIYSMMTLVYFMIASQFCHLVDASSYKIDKLKNIVKNAKGKRKIPSIFKCLYLLDRKAEEMQSVNEIFDKQLFYVSFNAFTACILNGYYGIVYTIIGNQGFLYGMGYFTGIMVKLLGVLLICTCCTTAQKYVSKILNVRNQIWNI
ncbi:unnamed protein product [Nesidiocoris tenuis]|uniref:Uncharacterized protein n=1 Tax=Nesidiocoris tenuis TaxID=355587 RepID=A0A6H5G9I4_9HEMI|nr:unnamed protein product [Nesidiocoris tenuis]